MAVPNENAINQDFEHIREKFNFLEEDRQSVPQNPFIYLRETFKDTAFSYTCNGFVILPTAKT